MGSVLGGCLMQQSIENDKSLCKGALGLVFFCLILCELTRVVAQLHFGICLYLNKIIHLDRPQVPPLIFLLCFKMYLNSNPPLLSQLNPLMNGSLSWDRLQSTLLVTYCTSKQAKARKYMAKSNYEIFKQSKDTSNSELCKAVQVFCLNLLFSYNHTRLLKMLIQ